LTQPSYKATQTPPSPSHGPAYTTDTLANALDQGMTNTGKRCQLGDVLACTLVSEVFAAEEPCRQGDAVACQGGMVAFETKLCRIGDAEACRFAAAVAQMPPPKSSRTVAITSSTTTAHVPLTRTSGGSLIVAASINGSAPIRFTLDSGAEALVLPSSMAQQLVRQGIIANAEFLGGGVSEFANGSQARDLRFRLRSVNIGGIVVQNIICVVVDGDGSALLGQAVLSKLRSWKIDNERQTLDIS
jgi:clan AA aspartic protease (TIGR02281 family)